MSHHPTVRTRLAYRSVLLVASLAVLRLWPTAAAADDVVQVRIRKNVMCPARDGVRLATDIYLPDGDDAPPGPFPAILIRTPYNKSGVAATAEFFTSHGYAVAVQDVRGRYASGGEFYIYVNEGNDGYDALEWVAAREWSSGDVGTYGGSYLAATQNALAVLKPPHLKAMFVAVGTSNYIEDGAGRGGAFALLHNIAYAFRLAYTGEEADPPEEGQGDTEAEVAVRAAYERLGDWLRAAPLGTASPLAWTPAYLRWYQDWRDHPTYDAYWRQNGYNFEEHHSRYPDIPIYFVGGWYDIFKRGTLRNFTGLCHRSAPTKLLMGPWTHSVGITYAGDVDFGADARLSLKNEAVRWFNHYLKGEDADIASEPPVKYFLMGGGSTERNQAGRLQSGGVWKTATEWPPSGFRGRKLYLHGDGQLRETVCAAPATSRFQHVPADPVPTIGGNLDSGKQLVRRGAQNQVLRLGDFGATSELPLSARRDVLTFETPALDRDLEVTGPVRAVLWVASSATDTDFTAKLIDVHPPSRDYPAGYAMNLEDGILRLRFRDSRERQELLTPGAIYKITIDLWAVANLFQKGHKIRLDVASSNFPMYDVNPNTGEPLGRHTHTTAALNTVYHDAAHASFLLLPVRE